MVGGKEGGISTPGQIYTRPVRSQKSRTIPGVSVCMQICISNANLLDGLLRYGYI